MIAFLIISLVATATAQYQYVAPQNNIVVAANVDKALHPQTQQPFGEEFNKEFYSYSAPDQDFEDPSAGEQISRAVRRNVRVIFIKGPENKGLEQAALQLAKSASEDRTAIYVLSKQSDIGSLVNQLQELKSQTHNKPDVHFVKYRTQAEAETAQRAIQAEYDSLPGTTVNNGPRSATILDFASKSAASFAVNPVVASTTSAPSTTAATPSRGYIPPRSSYFASKRF